MKMNSAGALVLALSLSSLPLHHGFGQGDLNPPPGPPAPTMKTLDQVEARTIVNATNTPGDGTNSFIISAPGSYYLTGNITGTPGLHGISIQANDVTLDLNGFALISGGGGATRGVDVPTAHSGICIRNGSVRGWTGDGIHGQAAEMRAEKLQALDCVGNSVSGLAVGNGSIVKDCTATSNYIGIFAGDRSQVTNCIATLNTVGFSCTSYVTLLDCTASRGTYGIQIGGSSSVLRCTVGHNDSTGIIVGPGCTVADCTSGANAGFGISVGAGCTVRNCTAQANNSAGIYCQSSCYVTGNTCDGNSGSGIETAASTTGCRIDANSCSSNAQGYFGGGNNHLFIRNSAHGNGISFNIGSEPAGPIANITGGGTITSTSPWANFIF